MSIASRIAAQGAAGGRAVKQTSRGAETYAVSGGSGTSSSIKAVPQETASEEAQRRANLVAAQAKASEEAAHYQSSYTTPVGTTVSQALKTVEAEYEEILIGDNIKVVVDSEADRTTVLSQSELSYEEILDVKKAIDQAGDIPSRTTFQQTGDLSAPTWYYGKSFAPETDGKTYRAPDIESTTGGVVVVPTGSTGGGATSTISQGMLLLLVGAAVALYLLFGKGRK